MDNLELEDMTIPDVINVNGNHKYMNGHNNKYNHSQRLTSGGKPVPVGGKSLFEAANSNMLREGCEDILIKEF